MVNIDGLTTETVNEATKHIDEMDALGIVTLINQEDKKAVSYTHLDVYKRQANK